MLDNIKHVASDKVILMINAEIDKTYSRLRSGNQSTGSDDIYGQILRDIPLGNFLSRTAWLLRNLFPISVLRQSLTDAIGKSDLWNRDRKILSSKALIYDYKIPVDQLGETIETLAELYHKRYPSHTYEDFQLYQLHINEINEATYQYVLSKENIATDITNRVVLDIH